MVMLTVSSNLKTGTILPFTVVFYKVTFVTTNEN
jgi:hypothetical protein